MSPFEKDIRTATEQFEEGKTELARININRLWEFDSSHIGLQRVRCRLIAQDQNWTSLRSLTRRALYFAPFDEEFRELRHLALQKLDRLDLWEEEQEMHKSADAWHENDAGYLSYADERIVAEKGVLYIAMDAQYVTEASHSVASFKRFHPDIPCALITASECEDSAAFDHVIRVERDFNFNYYFSDPKRMASIKVQYMRMSPYRQTLYLDADTYIVKPINKIFEGLDHSDFIYFEVPRARFQYITGDEPTEYFLYGLATPFVLDSGVIAFRKSARMDHFLDVWMSEFIALQAGPNHLVGNWGKGVNDQATLIRLIQEDRFRTTKLRLFSMTGWQYNSKGFSLGLLAEHDLLRQVRLIHMNDIADIIKEIGEENLHTINSEMPFADFHFPLVKTQES